MMLMLLLPKPFGNNAEFACLVRTGKHNSATFNIIQQGGQTRLTSLFYQC